MTKEGMYVANTAIVVIGIAALVSTVAIVGTNASANGQRETTKQVQACADAGFQWVDGNCLLTTTE